MIGARWSSLALALTLMSACSSETQETGETQDGDDTQEAPATQETGETQAGDATRETGDTRETEETQAPAVASSPDGPAAAAPATAAEFLVAMGASICDFYRNCVGVVPGGGCEGSPVEVAEAMGWDLSEFVYHAALGEQCLAQMNEQVESCSAWPTEASQCQFVLEGSGDVGDPCVTELDCKLLAYCDTSASCPGTCQPRAVEGESCEVVECAEDLQCYQGTCTAPAAEGERCGALACLRGLSCVSGECRQRVLFQQQLGEACTDSSDCRGFAFCDPSSRTCVPAGKEGESCSTKHCQLDLACADSTCKRPGPAGAECTVDAECETYRCHDNECLERADIGQDCEEDLDCYSFTCSEAGTCVINGSCE